MSRTRQVAGPLALTFLLPLLLLAALALAAPRAQEKPARPASETAALTRDQASAFARLALKGVRREYPNKPEHVLAGPADVKSPRALHPAFYGCYDWHSSVHGHWMLARLARLKPQAAFAAEARRALNQSLTAANLAAEVKYLNAEGRGSFERPYGLAWLLQLAAELKEFDDPDA